jgi:hypothetical protein
VCFFALTSTLSLPPLTRPAACCHLPAVVGPPGRWPRLSVRPSVRRPHVVPFAFSSAKPFKAKRHRCRSGEHSSSLRSLALSLSLSLTQSPPRSSPSFCVRAAFRCLVGTSWFFFLLADFSSL